MGAGERAWDQGYCGGVATVGYVRVKSAHALVTMTWKILTIGFTHTQAEKDAEGSEQSKDVT